MKVPKDIAAKILAAAIDPPAPPPGTHAYAEVPVPPSVNNLFVTRGARRFKSPEYRAWLLAAVPVLANLRKPGRLPAEIRVTVFGPINAARDLDNLLKPIGDALVAAGVIPGDSVKHVGRWTVERKPDSVAPAAVAVVAVAAMEGM